MVHKTIRMLRKPIQMVIVVAAQPALFFLAELFISAFIPLTSLPFFQGGPIYIYIFLPPKKDSKDPKDRKK